MTAYYRKYPGDRHFMKLVNGQIISVFVGVARFEIISSAFELSPRHFNDDSRTQPSNAKEFNKAMSTAQYEITKND